MERGKSGPGRGGKNKAPQHPADLFALGSKSTRTDLSDPKRVVVHGKPGPSHALPGVSDRKRELPSSSSSSGAKKAKVESPLVALGGGLGGGLGARGEPSTLAPDTWEIAAIDCEAVDLVPSVGRAMDCDDSARAKNLLCGAIKLLRSQRAKPDKVLYLGLMYIATVMPQLFSSEKVTQALCSLLRRDPTLSFKSKGNPTVPVLAANLLFKGYQEQKHWPESFVKVYVEDSIGERVWVDMEETRGFVSNLVTGLLTRSASRSVLPELGLGAVRSDSPTVSGSTTNTDDEAEGEAKEASAGGIGVKLEAVHTMPRYSSSMELVEHVVMEAVREQLNRRQPPEAVNRNFLRLLSSASGLCEVRLAVAPRLELWLQNPKLMRPTQELLLAVCANCTTHTPKDTEVIGHLVKIRLKTKALINLYLSGIKELIAANPENLGIVLKLTIYNELSTARNPNNMAVLAVLFQSTPEHSAALLAEIFQELLMNREDYLRPLRALLRELVRVLRHDLPLVALCKGLMRERRDTQFREFTAKERMLSSVADLVSLCVLLAVSPAVREAAGLLSRGDRKEIQTLQNFQVTVAKIQRDGAWWLQETVIRMYHPSSADFAHALNKVLFLESLEQYHNKDNWPSENERSTILRLATEVPVLQNTLIRLSIIGLSKDHPLSCPDTLELLDKLIKRAAAVQYEGCVVLQAEKMELYDLMFSLSTYRHPENINLPAGYYPPQLAISNLYWKAWIMLLILSAHNPSTFGSVAWEKYPMLRALMEMCITNHFTFPPPTMAAGEEPLKKEAQLASLEKEQILEFETHLAAASTKITITEQTSLLLTQLTSLDPMGPARRPPPTILALLRTLNETLHLGHRLCRSRRPDFLLDVIQRQGASQSMPWLADLVESSEGALSHLPVQCLCEFLLSDSTLEASMEAGSQTRHLKQQQLLQHLRALLLDITAPDSSAQCCEVLEYFLRRLASAKASSRAQAIRGLKVILSGEEEEEEVSKSSVLPRSQPQVQQAWLLVHLPALPHFAVARPQAVIALRQACQVENELSVLRAYLTFLAQYAVQDMLSELADLVLDMAQLIVERNTIAQVLLPSLESEASGEAMATLHALMLIFMAYLQKAREPRKEAYTWSESQDQILVTWSTGEESTMHILVVHAIIILLTHGPGPDPQLFQTLMEMWVPKNSEPPKAFLVDTSEEALLIPDWLKLRMIQSTAPGLVDSALMDLEPPQLLLFVQSFGIQPSNMSKLLHTLDRAVTTDPEAVREAVQDKTYMVQLVQVQHYRGATGGHTFLSLLHEPPCQISETPALPSSTLVRPLMPAVPSPSRQLLRPEEVGQVLISLFPPPGALAMEAGRQHAFNQLQRALSAEIRTCNEQNLEPVVLRAMLTNLENLMTNDPSMALRLLNTPHFSCPLFRLSATALKCHRGLGNVQASLLALCSRILAVSEGNNSMLHGVLKSYVACCSKKQGKGAEERESPESILKSGSLELCGRLGSSMQASCSKELVEAATQKMLEQTVAGPLSTHSTGLLLDWLSCLEPEMIRSCPPRQMQLLFSKAGTKQGGAAACRPYLLTLLTHRTSWTTLHQCMTALLQECNTSYDPAAVLDFLWALIGNPKLWQGREKRTPKHHNAEDILGLSMKEVCVLLDYVVEEALTVKRANLVDSDEQGTVQREVLEGRVPLLLQCMQKDAPVLAAVVKHLAPVMMARDGLRSVVTQQLLLQLYLCVPGLIVHLVDSELDAFLAGAGATELSSSTLDATSHTLLTALATTPRTKDWSRRSQEFELAARKMAAVHPILVLRQLPLLAASLRGRVHLDSGVFRVRNHLLFFQQVLGLLELLQPHLFAVEHALPLEEILDSFFSMFRLHTHLKEVQFILARSVLLLQNLVSHDAQRALKYLQKHCQLLNDLQAMYPSMPGLQTLLAGLSLPKRDGDEPELLVAAAMGPSENALPSWTQAQVACLLDRLNRHAQGEDVIGALQDLEHLSLRRPAVLEAFFEPMSLLLLAPANNVRSLAHSLMLRLLKHSPGQAEPAVTAFLRCLDSPYPDVLSSALEKLPEVVVCAQEFAMLLLERLFRLGMRSAVNTAPNISRAIALLHLQDGC